MSKTTDRNATMISKDEAEGTVCGKTVKHDASGVGHAWRAIARDDIPANIVEEIEGEIIDGEQESCDDFVGSNGQHYRW